VRQIFRTIQNVNVEGHALISTPGADNVKAVTGHDELKIVVAAHKHVNTQYQAKVVKDDIESHFAIGSKGQNVIDALRRLLVVTCEAVGKEIENAEHRRRFEY